MQLLKPSWVSADGHALMSIDIHPDGTRFVTGGQGKDSCGRICIWNMRPITDATAAKDKSVPKLLTQMDHHQGCVNTTRWSNNGHFLASGGDDKVVMLWQKSAFSGGSIFGGGGKVHMEQWRLHKTLRGHDGDVLDLAWGPGDVVLATASVDNNIIIWNMERLPEQVTILKGHTSLVKGVFFDPVGKYLASQSDDKTLRIWKTSDWSQEVVIGEPFRESGATTHVLRPGWSPDGSMIVTAHAMNGGGPTAQIVERSSWRANRDFVGHKKAVSCVRFNSRVFEKSNQQNGKTEMFVVVAMGSRDRSFSVWITGAKRPYFVINDSFDQGILDLAWSRDGRVLMACSMDGSITTAILKPNELGKTVPESRLYDSMREQYGKNYGTIANLATSSACNITNGGPVVIENPEMLKKDKTSATNGHDISRSSSNNSLAKSKLYPQNPTDKQIEARTSDGRRRITPIFIPPPNVENGAPEQSATSQRFGMVEFGSSSTQEKSRIAVEKRNDIVKPNISPGKTRENEHPTSDDQNNMTKQDTPTTITSTASSVRNEEPKVNIIQVKKKPSSATTSTTSQSQEPKVNVIAIKKKPGPVTTPPSPKPSAQSTPKTSPPPSLTKKRKRVAVISDSSEDDDEDDEIDENRSGTSSSKQDEKKSVDPSKNTKLKDSKVKKPDMVSNRAHLESSPKRPRGRPPFNRESSYNDLNAASSSQPPVVQPSTSGSLPPVASEAIPNNQPIPNSGETTLMTRTAHKLPALKMDKTRVYNFNMLEAGSVTVQINNNLVTSKLHEVKCISEKYNWSGLTSSLVITVVASQDLIIVLCKNGSLHMFKPSERGQRIFPPLQLPSPVSKMSVNKGQVALITTCAHLYIWELVEPKPKIKVKKEDIQSLLISSNSNPEKNVTVAKLITSPDLIIITSVGRSFTFDEILGSWLCLTDTSSSIQGCSNYATASANMPNAIKDLPLASLGYLTPVQPPKLQSTIDQQTMALANLTHCRNQRLSAEYLKSPKEYEYWLMAEIRNLATNGDVEGLRMCFDWLRGRPTHAIAENDQKKSKVILGTLNKRDLLKSGLSIIKSNLQLQRLYTEYEDQLTSVDEVSDIDKMLDV